MIHTDFYQNAISPRMARVMGFLSVSAIVVIFYLITSFVK